MARLVEALQRLQDIRTLGMGHIDLSTVPPVRVQALALYAAAARAQAINRMPPPRRHATLLAFAKVQETAALDDVVDLLDQLITAMLARVEHAGQRRRLCTLKDLDSAALQLHEACLVLLDPTCRRAEMTTRHQVSAAEAPADRFTTNGRLCLVHLQEVSPAGGLVGPSRCTGTGLGRIQCEIHHLTTEPDVTDPMRALVMRGQASVNFPYQMVVRPKTAIPAGLFFLSLRVCVHPYASTGIHPELF
jgi:hypothetical protein